MSDDDVKKNHIVIRGIITLLIFAVWGVVNRIINIAAPIISGEMAVRQLENSDWSYVSSQFIMRYFSGSPMPKIILLLVLIAIWWKPLKKVLLAVAILPILMMNTPNAIAYYDTKDYPEYIEIQPNQSAFLIPVAGANQDTQGQFMSVDYLTKNKVATKRVQIPHALIRNPGWSSDYYVPAAKLIIVDRTPYNREWVNASDRGTSARKEGFHFESSDSINISTGIVTAAYVKEEDAAKFLYWFGTKADPNAKLNDPNVNFASVSYGRSLSDVMDTVVRGKIQAVLAREFGSRSLDNAIREKSAIISLVEKEVKESFINKGITIDYVGYAEALSFNERIQASIDKVFVTQKDAQAEESLKKMLPLYQQQAEIAVKNGIAASASKWNGQINLPSFLVVPSDFLTAVTGWVKSEPGKADTGIKK
ncbi:MAG: hypothetical protein BWK80_49210 [Desulfobacteraceae bacterium IS3]|nr:MAG: hypothetical protein BWK80_49210 [Desulfobacteraceae bacterium IS3]